MFKLIDLIFYLVNIIYKNPVVSFFSILGLFFVYQTVFKEKKFITVYENDFKKEYVNRFNNDYKDIWSDGVTFVVNNSGENLVFESVTYKSLGKMFDDVDNDIKIIPPIKNKIQVLQNNCNYIFKKPPRNIKSKNSSTKKYWLHRE